MRRYCGKPVLLPAAERRVYLGLGLAGLLALVVPSIWSATIMPVMTFTAAGDIDFQIIMASLLTLLGYGGGLILALINGWIAWRRRGWLSRMWSLALIISFGILFWIAWQFKLLSFSTDF
jgi:Na+/phosphate symporter